MEYDEILQKYSKYTREPIMLNGVRILRPDEYERIRSVVPKPQYKIMLQTLLYTGMRYIETQRFHKHKGWYRGEFIHLPKEAVHKNKRTQLERYVRLNEQGRMAVEQFLYCKNNLPTVQAWGQNMKRWAKYGNLRPLGLCAKTTRKTWESWLVYYYPERAINVAKSQGHNLDTQYEHYLNMPFTDIDKFQMKKYVEGWI